MCAFAYLCDPVTFKISGLYYYFVNRSGIVHTNYCSGRVMLSMG
jgi:hypothetical protein